MLLSKRLLNVLDYKTHVLIKFLESVLPGVFAQALTALAIGGSCSQTGRLKPTLSPSFHSFWQTPLDRVEQSVEDASCLFPLASHTPPK